MKYVKDQGRKSVPRPQPPHEDRRQKRQRTRSEQERQAKDEQEQDTSEGESYWRAKMMDDDPYDYRTDYTLYLMVLVWELRSDHP